MEDSRSIGISHMHINQEVSITFPCMYPLALFSTHIFLHLLLHSTFASLVTTLHLHPHARPQITHRSKKKSQNTINFTEQSIHPSPSSPRAPSLTIIITFLHYHCNSIILHLPGKV
ncbi:hypothetical protein VIGAN_08125100 [Vigna angularis var. angularis]|uniref:Uncharacterized protein n=1 Tax=Vigna angularis var. angularis TaxID=157739 RepID=A0A0S3SP78_PHAAN|nr:hypothetical protein VIGAN_08125100 [Vigna angularis var. angularis]